MTDLPKPDVNVTTNAETGATDVVISRDGKAQSFRSEKKDHSESVKEIVETVIADPKSAEWLPPVRRDW